MMFRCALFIALMLVFFACSDRTERNAAAAPAWDTPLKGAESSLAGGRLVRADLRVIDLDSMPAPRLVPLQEPVRTVPLQNSRSRVFRAKTEEIPGPLVVVTPGRYGIRPVVSKKAQPEIKPALHSEPVPALPAGIRDVATHDMQYMDVIQGLTSSYIRTILEDRLGNIWIATSSGVSRYDGQYFVHYKEQNGLRDEMVLSMLEDSRGHLWFGTGNGVSCYDGQRFLNFGAEQGFKDCKVRHILEDSHGDIWFGTDAGVIRYDLQAGGGTFFHYTTEQGLIHNNTLSMVEDDRGYLWFGSDQGLSRFDGFNFTHFTDRSGLTSNLIFALYSDSKGNLWLGMDNGLSRYDNNRFIHYASTGGQLSKGVNAILEDKRGHLWLGTQEELLRYAYGREQGTLDVLDTQDGLSGDRIRCLLEDSQGNLWIGTGGGGIFRYREAGFHHLTEEAGLINNGVVCIMEDHRGQIWFGTDDGLSRYDGRQFTQLNRTNGLINENIHALLEDSRGYLWIGSRGGLSRFDGANFVHYSTAQGLPDSLVLSLLEDKRGHIWMATRGGLCRLVPDGKSGKIYQYRPGMGAPDHHIWDMLEDREGRIWLGTQQGLALYEAGEDEASFRYFTTKDGLIDKDVITVMQDYRGYLWLGTAGGISRFHADSLELGFVHFTVQDGLSDNRIWSLQEDRNRNIWVSTEKGITLLRPRPEQTGSSGYMVGKPAYDIFTFGRDDGLKRLDFQANSVCLDRQNRIWWGAEGATTLDLTQFSLADQPPGNLVLTNLEVNQQFVDYRQLGEAGSSDFELRLATAFDSVAPHYNYPVGLRLPHCMDHLTFHFSAIHWARPRVIAYEYYLEGLEKSWNRSSAEPRADYRNLRSGTYTFHVRAKGDAAQWSEPFSYTFTVLPPWYWTWGARFFYLFAIVMVLYLVFHFLKNRWVLQDRLKQERIESERLKELSERLQELDAIKSRLYTNLTHEFRTPLTVILGMAEQIRNDPDRFTDKGVELIERNGQRLLQLINQLLDLAKLKDKSFRLQLQRGNIVPHLQHIVESFESLASRRQLRLAFNSKLDRLVMNYDPLQVEHILVNLISNALKFTLPHGSVAIGADRQGGQLLISVADTGIGIADKELAHIFERFYQVDSTATRAGEGTGIGLAHTRELVLLMGGTISVESRLGVGSTFTVRLPIRTEALEVTEQAEGTALTQPPLPAVQAATSRLLPAKHPLTAGPRERASVVLPKVLIIEDNPDTATYLATCMSDRYEITVAGNGAEGIQQALEIVPDAIVSDVMMPQADGFEVCTTLKQDDRTSHIPIILLTARTDRDARLTGLGTGADAYLDKPVDREELLIRLEALLKNQKKMLAYFSKRFENGITADDKGTDEEHQISPREKAFIDKVRKVVEDNYSQEDFTLEGICVELSISRYQLFRKMKALIDTSPSHFIRTYRLEKAKFFLETTDLNVSQVAYKVGFKDVAHFSKSFQEEFGYSPSEANR